MIQGWKITDNDTISEITATKPIPGPRRAAAGLLVPGSDFWVLDDQVVLWNHFAGDGSWVGEEKCDDPAVAKLCAASFDAAWDRAIPHQAYQPA